jgi:hypothetical protein
MPAKQQMAATEQESMQDKKEDTTQHIHSDEHNCKRGGSVFD